MKIINVTLSCIGSFLLTYSMFVTALFLIFISNDLDEALFSGWVIILFALSVFCFCFYTYLSSKNTNLKYVFLKGTSGLFTLMCLMVAILVTTLHFISITYVISSEIGKSPSLKERLELYFIPFRKDQHSTTDYNSLKENKLLHQYKNVKIYYNSHEENLLPVIEDAICRSDKITTSLLGKMMDYNIDLLLHPSPEDLSEKTSLPETIGYFDDPSDVMGIAITNIEDITQNQMPGLFYFTSTIMHEYTHYRFQAFIKNQGLSLLSTPIWFHEGIAEYVGMYETEYRHYPVEKTPLYKLLTHGDWEHYRLEGYAVYQQSYYAIKYLIDNYGEEIIIKIIGETARTDDFNQGFKHATGLTVQEFDSVYLEYRLKQK